LVGEDVFEVKQPLQVVSPVVVADHAERYLVGLLLLADCDVSRHESNSRDLHLNGLTSLWIPTKSLGFDRTSTSII
jgi:hypothetical protein